MDRDTLAREYRRISDEELIRMVSSGKLTELAQAVALDELSQRGIDPGRPPAIAAVPDPEPEVPTAGFATIYQTLSLGEAHALKGWFEIVGIPAHIADQHTVQTVQLWAPAMGGFRLRVPGEVAEDGARLVSEYRAGRLALADDEPSAPLDPRYADVRLWNPDLAAGLSVFFTPVFSAIIHALNWRALRDERRARAAWIWAACLGGFVIAASAWGIAAFRDPPVAGVVLRHLLLASLACWYFAAGRAQAKLVVGTLKGAYVRAGWFTPLWIALILASIASPVTPIWRFWR